MDCAGRPLQHPHWTRLPAGWRGDGLRHRGREWRTADRIRVLSVQHAAGLAQLHGQVLPATGPTAAQPPCGPVLPRDEGAHRSANQTGNGRPVYTGWPPSERLCHQGGDPVGRSHRFAASHDALGDRARRGAGPGGHPTRPASAGRGPEPAGSHSCGRDRLPHRLPHLHCDEANGEHQYGVEVCHHGGRPPDLQHRAGGGGLHQYQVRQRQRRLAGHELHDDLRLGDVRRWVAGEDGARPDRRVLPGGLRGGEQPGRLRHLPHDAAPQEPGLHQAGVEESATVSAAVPQLPHPSGRRERAAGGRQGGGGHGRDPGDEAVRGALLEQAAAQLPPPDPLHGRLLELLHPAVHDDHLPYERHGQDGPAL